MIMGVSANVANELRKEQSIGIPKSKAVEKAVGSWTTAANSQTVDECSSLNFGRLYPSRSKIASDEVIPDEEGSGPWTYRESKEDSIYEYADHQQEPIHIPIQIQDYQLHSYKANILPTKIPLNELLTMKR